MPKPGKSTRMMLRVWGRKGSRGLNVSVDPPMPCRQMRVWPELVPVWRKCSCVPDGVVKKDDVGVGVDMMMLSVDCRIIGRYFTKRKMVPWRITGFS